MNREYENLVKLLKEKQIPCEVKLFESGEISVEFGTNYPEEFVYDTVDGIYNIAASAGVSSDKLNVCASSFGFKVVESQMIAGGPKTYYIDGRLSI